MRNTSFVILITATAAFVPVATSAQAKPEPEFTFTGNAGLFSDYRFRGFTQTDYKHEMILRWISRIGLERDHQRQLFDYKLGVKVISTSEKSCCSRWGGAAQSV